MNIVFVSYGFFENNSAYHVAAIAERLFDKGHRIGFIAAGSYGGDGRKVVTGTVDQVSSGTLDTRLTDLLEDRSTIIHAWTPRETVRRVVEALVLPGLRYVVHLEDDERLITAAHLKVRPDALDRLGAGALPDLPGHISHPRRSLTFMNGASGVTAIVDSLLRDVPSAMPVHRLEPGVETSVFQARLSAPDRMGMRQAYGIPPEATLLVYHGNAHKNNERDLFSLHTAIRILRQNGRDVRLIRTGERDTFRAFSTDYRAADGVVRLDFVDRAEIPRLLDLADMYVQPGWATPFNARRFPSKVPEFLAMGRPVILPEINVGRRLTDAKNAIILQSGGAKAIVAGILRVRNDAALARTVGEGGRAFAIEHLDWDRKVAGLEDFYAGLPG